MALIRPVPVDPALLKRVAEAEEFLKETGEFYRQMSREARAAGDESPAKARERLHDYRKTAMAALEEGRRVADELNRSRGIVRDFALDLRLARDEVERLLDRLAAEVGAGEISGSAE
jgi:hypothetical protein